MLNIVNLLKRSWLLVLAGFFTVNAFMAVRSIQHIQKGFDSVAHTLKVMRALDEPLAVLLQVESGARGYALTGIPRFIDAYELGRRRAGPMIQELRRLMSDNLAVQANLNRLEVLMNEKLGYSRDTMEAMRKKDSAAARENVRINRGGRVLEEIRALVGRMQEEEQRLLSLRGAAADMELRRTRLAWWISSAVSLALLAFYFLLQRRSLESELASATRIASSEERFRTFVDNSPMMSSIKDAEGRVRWTNRAFRKEFAGVEPGQGMDKLNTEMELDQAKGEIDENDRAVLRGETREYVMEIPSKGGGSPRCWLVLGFPVNIHGENLIGISALDVTHQRDAEQKLENYTKELERSNRELQDFASVAAHDLQEPLRKIRAFGDLLEAEQGEGLSADSRDYVARMQASAARMQALIEDLLSYSRVSTKAGAMAAVDLGQTLAEVQADLELALAQGGLSIENEALPVVEADATQMRQLFQNLVANAVKFRTKDSRPVLRISSSVNAGQVELAFRDNGIGFDNRYADKIFTIFQRLHGRDEYEGNGVGLAVCRKIAERHGGTIRAEGEKGKGAVFFVRLPLKQAKGKRSS